MSSVPRFLESLPGLALALDDTGRVLACTAACAALLGCAPDALAGRHLWELLATPEDAERVRRLFSPARLEDFPFRLDAAWKLPEGEERWVGLMLGVTETREHQPWRLVATGLELTGYWQAQRELQSLLQSLETTTRRMETVLQQLPAGVIIRDAAGRLADYNDQAQALLGYRLAAVLTESNPSLQSMQHMDGTLYPARDAPFLRALRGESTRNERLRYHHPDGRERVLEFSTAPIRDEDGAIQAGVLVMADRTEQVRAEEALRELYVLASSQGPDFDARLDALLALGCRRFGMKQGVLARTLAGTREVLASHGAPPEEAPTPPGQPLEAPVRVKGRAFGVLGFQGPRLPQRPGSASDVDLLKLMALWVGGELEREQALQREHLLAESGAAFTASLDEHETLLGVARLFVRGFADFCLVDRVDAGESSSELMVMARDAARAELAEAVRACTRANGRHPLLEQVLLTGQPHLWPIMDDAVATELARGPEHLALLRSLSPRSAMAVPLVARGRTLGVVGLLSSSPRTVYDEDALRIAEALCHRAALAMDNARLYHLAQRALSR